MSCTEPLRSETFHFDRAWLQNLAGRMGDVRGPQFRTSRELNLPPQHLLIHRVTLASVAVLNMDDAGDTAAAAAMATLIVASSAVVSLLFAFLSGWLTRRTQRWRQP